MIQRAFDILGIPVTKDVRQIKRTYAGLVRRYHPEEYPVEWSRIHDAYQAAMDYAETGKSDICKAADDAESTETNVWEIEEFSWIKEQDIQEPELQQNTEVMRDARYEEVYQEVHPHWMRERTEHETEIGKRLEELRTLRRKKAEEEWRLFFEKEFRWNEGIDELALLLDTVENYSLPENVLRIILPEMDSRAGQYSAKGEPGCRCLSEEIAAICKNKIAASEKEREKLTSPRRSISVAIMVCVVLNLFRILGYPEDGEAEAGGSAITIPVAANLNHKYDTKNYNIKTLSAEQAQLSDAHGDEIAFFEIFSRESWEQLACVIPKRINEDETRYLIFDNIQSADIKQAFEERLNERTGCAETRLFWDSSMWNRFDGIKDGYFQTRLDGDFDKFMQRETQARERVPESVTAYLDGSSSALNGICEYYISEASLGVEGDTWEDGFSAELSEASVALKESAREYHVIIRCVVIPEWNYEYDIEKREDGEFDIWACREGLTENGYWFMEYTPDDSI